jgi:uncharacterized protein (DUF1330 family)
MHPLQLADTALRAVRPVPVSSSGRKYPPLPTGNREWTGRAVAPGSLFRDTCGFDAGPVRFGPQGRSVRMTCYIVAQISISDRAGYADYESGFMDVFSRYQGRLLAVDESPEVLEGAWDCTRTVLVRFPSKEEARHWYHSAEYQELAQHRFAASSGNLVLIAGMDD